MKNIIITPTRNRPQQLNLVIDCINCQTVKPDFWMIVDDGEYPVDKTILDKIIIPYHYKHYRMIYNPSTAYNSAVCLQECGIADNYIFIDDDDYYPPTYIEHIISLLDKEQDNTMVGSGRWTDYRLSTGYYRVKLKTPQDDCMTQWHSSAIKGEELKKAMIQVLMNCPYDRYNDVPCFKALFRSGIFPCHYYDFGKYECISLKDYGVGTGGAILAHYSNDGLICDDDFSFFKSHLGNDWKRYEKYLGRLR